MLPNSPDTFILGDFNAHHPTWDRLIPPNPLGNDLFRWITSFGLEILNNPASPTLLYHSTRSLSSPDILLAPASLAPHCEWRTLPGLSSDHLPIEIVLPLLQFVTPTLVFPNSTIKRLIGMFTNHILLSTFPFLILVHSTSTRLTAPFPSSCRSYEGFYPLWPPWSFPQSLVVPGSGICSTETTEGPLRGTPI